MKNLPSALLKEKNRLHGTGAWLILVEIPIDDSYTLRIANNTEDVVFAGETYSAFPFEFAGVSEDSKGEVPSIELRVSNIGRTVQGFIEEHQGGVGWNVTLRFVHSAHLAEDYAELTYSFDVVATTYDAEWIVFKLGVPNPLNKRFPLLRFIANYCNWTYGSVECGHSGNPCKRTLESCRARGNSARFGGFPGLGRIGFRIV